MDQPDSEPRGQGSAAVRQRDHWVKVGLAGVCLLVYLRSLLPGIGYSGDTAKWQFIGTSGGVPHPTGYPLYVALNQFWVTLLPWGSPAWKANLLSAVLAIAAVLLLYGLLRLLGIGTGIAAATALVAALTRTFWSQAVIAEVYTLHLALMTGALFCLARWRLGGANRWLVAGLALYLLGFGNHMGTVLLAPGVAWLLWSDRRRALTVRNLAWAWVLAVAAAGQYLYVLYQSRAGTYVEHPVDNLRDLVTYVTGSYFKDQMFAFGPAELATTRLELAVRFLWEEYFILLAVIAFGLWRSFAPRRDHPRSARQDVRIAVALWGLVAGVFALGYDIPNVIVYFLPVFWVLAVFLAIGLDGIGDRLRDVADTPEGRARRWLPAAGALALIALPVVVGLADYRRASQRGNVVDAQRISGALDAAGRDAVLLTDGYLDSEYFWYYLLGEDMATTHNLAMAHMVTPDQVVAYFSGEPGPIADATAEVGAGGSLDAGPRLYTATDTQAEDLRGAGLRVIEVAPDTWEIQAPVTHRP